MRNIKGLFILNIKKMNFFQNKVQMHHFRGNRPYMLVVPAIIQFAHFRPLFCLRSGTLEVCDIISVTQYLLLLGWVSSKVAITTHIVSAPSD